MSHDTLMTTIQATQSGCEGGTSLQAQVQEVLRLQEGTGSAAQKLSMGPHVGSTAPCPRRIEKQPPLSTVLLVKAKVSCSSAHSVTPELIKCESLIVLAISHHLLLICIILVSILTNVT